MIIEAELKPAKHAAGLVFLALTLILLTASAARAQEAPRLEVFGGYSYLRMDSPSLGFADYSNLNGWNASATANLTLKWAVTIDLSGHYGSQLNVFNYMIGPQYTWRREKSKFFVRGMFGKAQNTVDIPIGTTNGVKGVGRAFAAGGGFDWDWSPRFTIRVVQADFLNTQTFGVDQNDLRVSTGLVFHFGHIGHHPKL